MSSKIFNALLEEKIDVFKSAFKHTSRTVFLDENKKKLIHSGEFGTYREKLVRDFLRFIIPQKLLMSSGFVISSTDEVSSQCDIIIYDSTVTPLIQSNELQTFFPVETVVGVGEIKSILSKTDFISAINKLARIKEIKSKVPYPSMINKDRKWAYDPSKIPSDTIFTFLICEKLDFDLKDIKTEINTMYNQDINYWHRHNVILSIEDGLLIYTTQSDGQKILFYGPAFNIENEPHFVPSDSSKEYHHFKTFAMMIFDGISNSTVLYPEMVHYLSGFTPVNNIV